MKIINTVVGCEHLVDAILLARGLAAYTEGLSLTRCPWPCQMSINPIMRRTCFFFIDTVLVDAASRKKERWSWSLFYISAQVAMGSSGV